MALLVFARPLLLVEWNHKGDVAAKTHGGSALFVQWPPTRLPDESGTRAQADGEPSTGLTRMGTVAVDEGEVFADDGMWGSDGAGVQVASPTVRSWRRAGKAFGSVAWCRVQPDQRLRRSSRALVPAGARVEPSRPPYALDSGLR